MDNEQEKNAIKKAADYISTGEFTKSLNNETIRNFFAVLFDMVKTIPLMQKYLDNLIFIAKDPNAKDPNPWIEQINRIQEALQKTINDNPVEAERLTFDEFIELHPEIFDMPPVQLSYLPEPGTKQLIEALISIIPNNHIKPINKLANEITRDFINKGEQSLLVSNYKAKKEIITKASLAYVDDNVKLPDQIKFTPYDREVHDGVITLWAVGNRIITPIQVYRAMNGMTDTEYISPQAIGAVTRSLDKSLRILVIIDFTQEATAYKKNVKATYEGYLLVCDKVTVTSGGRTQVAYKLLRMPILYEYAQISKQIITIPVTLLQTRGFVRSTEDVIVIRGYLLRQIEGMKSKKFKRSNNITYEGIYNELDMNTLSKKAFADKSLKIRAHVTALLKKWKEQEYIKDFNVYIDGKTPKGITITL